MCEAKTMEAQANRLIAMFSGGLKPKISVSRFQKEELPNSMSIVCM